VSAEKWDGGIDFDEAAKRCPFLSNIGEAALAEIRTELEQSRLEGPNKATSHKAEVEETKPVIAEEAIFEEKVSKRLALKLHVTDRPEPKQVEPDEIPIHEATIDVVAMLQATAAKTAANILPVILQSDKNKSVSINELQVEQPDEIWAHSVESSPTPQPAPEVSSLARAPVAIEMLLEQPDFLLAQPQPPIESPRVGAIDAASTTEVLPQATIPDATSAISLSVQLEDLTVETVLPERQPVVRVLIAKVYELVEAAPHLQRISEAETGEFELEPDIMAGDMAEVSSAMPVSEQATETGELERVVTLVLQELGMSEPTTEQIKRFIALVGRDVRLRAHTATELSDQTSFRDVLHEQVLGMAAPIDYLPLLNLQVLQLLGRIGLVRLSVA